MLALRGHLAKGYTYRTTPWSYLPFRAFSQTALRLDNVSQDGLPHKLEQVQIVQEDTHILSEEAKNEDRDTGHFQKSSNGTSSCSPEQDTVSQLTETGNKATKHMTQETSQWLQIKQYQYPYKRVLPDKFVRVPTLAHGLDRVLFNPGVHVLQDQRTKVFNFTPFLQNITQPKDFDYEAIAPYITSSRDTALQSMASSHQKRYVGSTSSVSAVLSQIYFALSNFKQVDTSHLSKVFQKESRKFTRGIRTPASIFLRYKDGVYSIDADKSYDVQDTILSVLGKSMEKVLTLPPTEYEKYLKSSNETISEAEKTKPEAFAYGEIGQFLLRSQLDCYHAKLPKKVFDLKTRAVIPIRMDQANYTDYLGYSLTKQQGLLESFEREYYDMIRAAFLKYRVTDIQSSFQARIGHMDGIFVAYHNTAKVFGFQYLSLEEIDARLFGNSMTGATAFRHTISLLEKILDTATKKHTEQSLRLSFHARQRKDESESWLNVFSEVVPQKHEDDKKSIEEKALQPLENLEKYVVCTKSYVNNAEANGDVLLSPKGNEHWDVQYKITEDSSSAQIIETQFRALRKMQSDTFGTSNEAGASKFMDQFRRISDQYLKLEKDEIEQQLIYDLQSRNLDEVSNAWRDLHSSKEFKKHKLRYLTSRVLEALDDRQIEELGKEFSVESTSALQQLGSSHRSKVIEEHLQEGIQSAPTYNIRRVSHLLGLRSVLPRALLEKELEKIMCDQHPSEKTTKSEHMDEKVHEPKLSLSQRLKQHTQPSVSNT
ncbi:hypothetical protein INT43_005922 [Umbelopsis isabellina]|uniref:Pet127-domain-containing protein n=1 Tax=Mortierella isabellina TaxID=91625 RepID=A0A8H7U9P1_MORIS|nr:hypothetical protein INT43_005922 [Umbelopsis isabellina]